MNLDSANIAFTLLKAGADGLPIGPLVLGMSRPAHVLVPSVTARGIVNVSAISAIGHGSSCPHRARLCCLIFTTRPDCLRIIPASEFAEHHKNVERNRHGPVDPRYRPHRDPGVA